MRSTPILSVFAALALLATGLSACAPAPLYMASGTHKGAVTLGEIPRDARGEPVWAAIRPAPGAAPQARQEETQEGDGEESPRPPRA